MEVAQVRVRHGGRHGGRLVTPAPGSSPIRKENEKYVQGDVIEVSEHVAIRLVAPAICEYVESEPTPSPIAEDE